MLLENVLAATGGKLLAEPAISRFDTIATNPKKAVRGSLFIAIHPEEIPQAVESGAYGILTDDYITPTDNEIAWIKVDSLLAILAKLLRLWLIKHPRKIFWVLRQHIEFIDLVERDTKIATLQSDEAAMSLEILNSTEQQIFFCQDADFLEHIGLNPEKPPCTAPEASIVSHTLFETSLILKNRFYERLSLIEPMSDFLLEAIGFLEALDLGWSLSQLDFTPSLEPVFVDRFANIQDFGESDRVLIFADSALPCRCYEHFNMAKWSRIGFIKNRNIKFSCDIKHSKTVPATIHDPDESLVDTLFEALNKPGYIVLIGFDKNELLNLLSKSHQKHNNPILKGLF